MDKELFKAIKTSFDAHVSWTVPRIGNLVGMLDAKYAVLEIRINLEKGVLDPKLMSSHLFWTPYGQKVYDTYKEIYDRQSNRYVDGWGTESCVERIL